MPSLYVYAVADGAFAVDDLRGVAGEPLQFVASDNARAHAIVGDLSDAAAGAPALNAETLHAQDALVRQLAARVDALLPARFGARFDDERTVRQTLDELASRLDHALMRVRGREQMTLRLFQDRTPSASAWASIASDDTTTAQAHEERQGQAHQPEQQPERQQEQRQEQKPQQEQGPGPGPGTRYLRQRAAEGRRWPPAIEELRAALTDAIVDERVERGQPPVIGSIHHLIPRGSADRYLARLEAAAAAANVGASGIRYRVSGPSPAYAFAEADLS